MDEPPRRDNEGFDEHLDLSRLARVTGDPGATARERRRRVVRALVTIAVVAAAVLAPWVLFLRNTDPRVAPPQPSPAASPSAQPTPTPEPSPTERSRPYVVGDTGGACLKVREGPGLNEPEAGCLAPGTLVQVTGEPREADGHTWLNVTEPESGTTGWSSDRFLQPAGA